MRQNSNNLQLAGGPGEEKNMQTSADISRARLNALINSATTMNLHSFHSILSTQIDLFHQYSPSTGLLSWNPIHNECLFMHSYANICTDTYILNKANTFSSHSLYICEEFQILCELCQLSILFIAYLHRHNSKRAKIKFI